MKKYFEYLLSDEASGITLEDYEERKNIVIELKSMIHIIDLGKIRHFQPQVGCLNACSICSKHASSNVSCWNKKRLRNVVAAFKHVALSYRSEKPYIAWNRENHRNGVIFSYLDNDIGNYYYLDAFIKLMYDELGVMTRISTVGYSRHNMRLNEMHKNINEKENLHKIGGFRISFTPYAIGWSCSNENYSRSDYMMDMANALTIYKPYYDFSGAGSRNMCVELRYKPLVILDKVYDEVINGHKVIACNQHVYISKDKNIEFNTSFISDPYDHKISLTEKPIYFYDLQTHISIETVEALKYVVSKFIKESDDIEGNKLVPMYKLENSDGHYYSVDPSISEVGNYGVNIYPKTAVRKNEGVVITERFALNAILKVKHDNGVGSQEAFLSATWEDAHSVLALLNKIAKTYAESGEYEKHDYIKSEVLPMLNAYIFALKQANYEAKEFFNAEFSIDTGIICNMGGAIKEFKGLTSFENEPLTPTHERNYGKHNSTMTKENEVYRVSCEYGNNLVVQKLNLFNTATREGQISFSKVIHLKENDETYKTANLKNEYLIPGQRRKE